ncbi:MAG: hypothetical protein AAF399_22425, partial [Bacteroidota bacterium]
HEVRGVGAAMSVAWDFGGFLHPFLPTKKDGRLSLRNPACGTGDTVLGQQSPKADWKNDQDLS